MIPIRCFTCNKVIGGKWKTYESHLQNGLSKEKSLNTIGLSRYCCRRMFLGHVDVVDKLILFSQSNDKGGNQNSKNKMGK